MYLLWIHALAEKLAKNRYCLAVRRSLIVISPAAVAGSFATMITFFPGLPFQQWMTSLFGESWYRGGQALINSSFSIISILFVVAISYFLAETHPRNSQEKVHPLIASFVSLSCFILLLQPFAQAEPGGPWLGKSGLLLAIITAFVMTEAFLFLCSLPAINISLLADEEESLIIGQAVSAIIPYLLLLAGCFAVKVLLHWLSVYDIHAYLSTQLSHLFTYITWPLGRALLFVLLVQILWFFGIHGNDLLFPVMREVYSPAGLANQAAVSAGLPPQEIFTDFFFNQFVFLGGSGATLCLIVCLLYIAKHKSTLRIAQLSFIPALFNINELLLFGLPIVMNPLYFLPFLLVPALLTFISYVVISAGLVPTPSYYATWTTPALFGGYLVTASWQGALLQLANLLLGLLIYLPFVKEAEKKKETEIHNSFISLIQTADYWHTPAPQHLLEKNDRQGTMARSLAHDLLQALGNNELFLEYQPQVDATGRVIGVEALLRWTHETYGRIPPPVIITLAEEAGIIDRLGKWIIDTACNQLRTWKQEKLPSLRLSINVSVLQLYQKNLLEDIAIAIERNQLDPHELEIEITEKFALSNDQRSLSTLEALHRCGVRIAIDDFGMGHSSLQYIKYFPVDTLKIDRSLSHDVLEDRSYQEIITSIVSLCSSLNIDVIVEYVETNKQRDLLKELGCLRYQGYLYSPALPAGEIPDFVRRHPH